MVGGKGSIAALTQMSLLKNMFPLGFKGNLSLLEIFSFFQGAYANGRNVFWFPLGSPLTQPRKCTEFQQRQALFRDMGFLCASEPATSGHAASNVPRPCNSLDLFATPKVVLFLLPSCVEPRHATIVGHQPFGVTTLGTQPFCLLVLPL